MLYFIVNEKSKSGNAKQIWKDIEEVLKVRNVSYQVFVSEYRGHAGKLAGEICAMDDDDICLVAVGGDGTANEMINGIIDFEKVRFGVIPTGSGNDLARGLALSKDPKNGIVHILNAMKKIYHLDKITKKEFEQLILTYHPYESIASIYLWKISQKKDT